MTALGAGLVFIAGILTLAISAAALHRSIITERKAQVKNLTVSAIGVLDHYYHKESNGILTLEQAQNEAKQVLRGF